MGLLCMRVTFCMIFMILTLMKYVVKKTLQTCYILFLPFLDAICRYITPQKPQYVFYDSHWVSFYEFFDSTPISPSKICGLFHSTLIFLYDKSRPKRVKKGY